jgi:sodium/potassium-transporting ATPase subunit alpha
LNPYAVEAGEALRLLGTSTAGLTEQEVARRRVEHGWNELPARRARPLAGTLLRQFTHFFAVILWIGAGLCFVAAWSDPQGGMLALGTAIVAVIVVNGAFSFLQEYRADRAMSALRRMLPLRTRVLRGGSVAVVAARDLVPGDVVLLETGDQVPADCRAIAARGLRVDTSALTGESETEWRDERPSEGDDPVHCRNALLAGTFVVGGRGRAAVVVTGPGTRFGRLTAMAESAPTLQTPLQREIARLAHLVAALAAGLGALCVVVGRIFDLPLDDNLLFAIGIVVANVPEGLLPTLTLSLAMASQRMARRHALVRRLPAVETLGCATVICTDKTGTLTQNQMQVEAIYAGGSSHAPSPADLRLLGSEHPMLFEGAALCNDLIATAGGSFEGDPMDVALARLGAAGLPAFPGAERLAEVPFDPDRRRIVTLHRTVRGIALHSKGALETILPLCASVRLAAGVRPLDDEIRSSLVGAEHDLAGRGLRVIAFAHRDLEAPGDPATLEREMTLSGLIGLHDPPRPEVPRALNLCRTAGIRVIMVTGDHPRTALAIAREIGLVRGTGHVMTGAELRRLSDAGLSQELRAPEVVIARADPMDKQRVVEALHRNGEIVAVTGDGANDAAALRAADIGIAMGLSGTDVAREAADLVLLDDNFATIVNAVEEGRAVYANVRKFLTYILTSNVPELVPYLAFVLLRVPLALTILQILAVDLGTDMLPALALGAEPPAPGTMAQPPRRRSERLADARLLLRAYLFLGAIEAAGAMAAFFAALHRGGWEPGRPIAAGDSLYLRATTACLTTLVVMQVANVLLCRSETAPFWSRDVRRNPLLAVAIAVELAVIVAIDYTSAGNAVFGTAPLDAVTWLRALPFAAAMIALEEGRKAFVRMRGAPRNPAVPAAARI